MKHIFKPSVPLFLSYVKNQTWANTSLELRVGSLKGHPHLVVGGRRARKILTLIETPLKAHRIHYVYTKQHDRDTVVQNLPISDSLLMVFGSCFHATASAR